jgi:hypothetical protein
VPYFQRSRMDGKAGDGIPAATMTDIVQRATSILDRESPPPVPAPGVGMFPIRGDQIEARMDQLRRQASDVIENIFTLVLAASSGGLPNSGAGAPLPTLLTSPNGTAGQAPILMPGGSVKAGEIAKIPFTVFNGGDAPVDLCFYGSDLISGSGFGIPASKITFSPRMVTLPSKERSTIDVNIPVPAQASPGIYAGLIQATGLDSLRAVVTIPVD